MKVSDFDYYLPEELIAQDPLKDRSSSRLLVLDKNSGAIEHRHFIDIKEYLSEGDCLVINDTKVIPARLLGVKEDTGAHAEILLLKRMQDDVWECLAKPGKKLKPGARVSFGEGLLKAEIVGDAEDGGRFVHFEYDGIFEEVLDKLGEMPLPPYITHKLEDKNRYQTVYAEHEGSAAAPTAGLHFTKELLSEIEAMGVRIARVTLHVGLGTFRPVKAETLEEHHMHSEYYSVSEETADIVNSTLAAGKKVFAVGTTSIRTLESAAVINPEYEELEKTAVNVKDTVSDAGTSENGSPAEKNSSISETGSPADKNISISKNSSLDSENKTGSTSETGSPSENGNDKGSCRLVKVNGLDMIVTGDGRYVSKYILKASGDWTSIFIYPGYEWKLTGSLITNFHLPKSTLVMLVSALAGKEHIMTAYQEAVKERYRFFSFGDAMLIK